MENLETKDTQEIGNNSLSVTETQRQEEKIRNYEEGIFCPNCGGRLTGRKCKLFCETPACGYLVTCSEF